MAAGTYWVGQNGQVYVQGADGTNAAGAYDANSNDYWGGQGYTHIHDPNAGGGSSIPYNNDSYAGGYDPSFAVIDPTASSNNYNGGTGGTGGTGSTQDAAFLTDRGSQLNGLLGRTDLAEQQALQNNQDQYDYGVGGANSDKEVAYSGYENQRAGTRLSKQQAQTANNVNANQGYRSLSQIIGRSAGSGSSAYRELLPSVIGKDLSGKQMQNNQAYGKNMGGIDQAQGQYDIGYEGVLRDLLKQKKDNEGTIRSGIESQRQGINAQLADNANQLAVANGGGYAQSRVAQQPYLDAINNSRNTVEGFFNQYRTPYSYTKAVAATPELSGYSTDKAAINAQSQGGDSGNPYAALLRKKLGGQA